MATVLVVEEPNSEWSMSDALTQRNPEAVVHIASPDDALEKLGEADVEILIVDVDRVPQTRQWLDTIREQHADLPIVLVSAESPYTSGTVKELMLGAASFVPRNRMSRDLALTVERIVALCCPEDQAPIGTSLRQTSHHYILTNDRAETIPVVRHLVAEFNRFDICQRPDRLRVAVAIEEAIVNAVVHGNLEIPSELRERGDDSYEQAIEARRRQAPYENRRIYLVATLTPESATVVVRDEGPGFDPQAVPDPTDPENLVKPHGRGMLLMRSFMDEVTYNAAGNEVTLIKRRVARQDAE